MSRTFQVFREYGNGDLALITDVSDVTARDALLSFAVGMTRNGAWTDPHVGYKTMWATETATGRRARFIAIPVAEEEA